MAWQASTRAKSPGSWTTRSTSSAYANRTSHISGSRSANPVNLLRRRQRKGLIARVYSWPERGHPCRTPRPKLTGLVRVQGQEGERQTVPTPEFQEVPDQIQVVEDGAAQDGVGLVWVDHAAE
ncbi:unnamed protein product [Caretta caretta]